MKDAWIELILSLIITRQLIWLSLFGWHFLHQQQQVQKPKSTRILYQLDSSRSSSSQKTVTLTLDKVLEVTSMQDSIVNTVTSTRTSVSQPPVRTLNHSASTPSVQGVWSREGRFTAVTLPETNKSKQLLVLF